MALTILDTLPIYEKPCAAEGLISYRYRGTHGWVMIGAKSVRGALREAARSINGTPDVANLQVWKSVKYVPVKG